MKSMTNTALIRREEFYTAQSGIVFIELAFTLPILVLMCLATLEIGLVVGEYTKIAGRVGLATRYLSTRTPGTGYLQAKCILAYGNSTCSIINNNDVLSQLDPLSGSASATINIFDSANDAAERLYQRTSTSSPNGVKVNTVRLEVVNYNHYLIFQDYLYNELGWSTPGVVQFNTISMTMRQAN
jgi:hypothetical protein